MLKAEEKRIASDQAVITTGNYRELLFIRGAQLDCSVMRAMCTTACCTLPALILIFRLIACGGYAPCRT